MDERRAARTSYLEPINDPGTAPADAPTICLAINAAWIPIVIGCLMQVLQPPAWTADSTHIGDLLGRVTDLIAIVGTAGVCEVLAMRMTSGCALQYSLDGGSTWITVTDWATEFPLCVRSNQARVVMDPAYSDPPIPEQNGTHTDWVYSPNP